MRCSRTCQRRAFMFFWEQADAGTGLVRDRSRTDGTPSPNAPEIGSIASVGFGLSGMCIAAERAWLPREQILERTQATLRFFAEKMPQEHGWFFHFVNLRDRRPRVAERAVVDRYGAPPRRGADGTPLLRRRSRDRPPRRCHLQARRFRLDARRRSGDPVARLEAGVRLSDRPMGSLLRADDPVPARHRIADARVSHQRHGEHGRDRR